MRGSPMRSSGQATAIRGRAQSTHDRLAKSLGYLSLALGAAELIAPRALCRATGLTGMAILASHDPAPWIWGRVAGDMADIATAASGVRSDGGQKRNAVLTLAALTAVTAVDVMCASGLGAEKGNRKTALADYSDRSGFPQGLEAARGAARRLTIPQDMTTPKSLRSHQVG